MSKQKKWYSSNSAQVLLAGFISLLLTTIFLKPSFYKSLLGLEHINLIDIDLSENRMVWTLITAIVSAPVAFAIWRLRDKNVSEQIENSRKDTNLKEFQKLAEWVSGAHFVEEKVSIKTKYEEAENSEKKVIEETHEYTTPLNELSIHTYSKMDGAIGLQIAAIYNLLPFYRGDHGESFKKPALNLLTSAWLTLQRKELVILDKKELSEDEEYKVIKKIKDNAKSSLGIAITRVLLSLNNQGVPCLTEHKEIYPGLCLAGMDFHIIGIDKKIISIFKNSDCHHINLIGSNLENFDFTKTNLKEAKLIKTYLYSANLIYADLEKSNFKMANLNNSNLEGANLLTANFTKAFLRMANLKKACLNSTKLEYSDLKGVNFIKARLTRANLSGADLQYNEFIENSEVKVEIQSLVKASWKEAKLDECLRKELEEYEKNSQHIKANKRSNFS